MTGPPATPTLNTVSYTHLVGGRVPDMRFYGVVVPVVVMMSCCVVVLTVVQNQVYTFRGVEYLDMRGVIHQSVHPGLLKADVADAEIGFAVSQRDKLLRNRVVCLRTGTFRDLSLIHI